MSEQIGVVLVVVGLFLLVSGLLVLLGRGVRVIFGQADRRRLLGPIALVAAGLAPSKGQARKDVEGGGIYVNNVKATDLARTLTAADVIFGDCILLRKGKRTYAVLKLV
jgi:hypothetical protein